MKNLRVIPRVFTVVDRGMGRRNESESVNRNEERERNIKSMF